MARFATGKYAWAYCDRCAIRCKYRDLREETIRGRPTGTLVCERCFDIDHPINFLPDAAHVLPDAEALQNARPDTGLATSRRMYPPGNWPPYPPAPSASISETVSRPGFRTGGAGENS